MKRPVATIQRSAMVPLSMRQLGNSNSAFGNGALQGISTTTPLTGSYNTALGDSALLTAQTTANENTAVGHYSLGLLTTGAVNTALGFHAGNVITTGSNNTILGGGVASTTLTTGGSNILIGTSNAVDTPATTTSNFLNIANVIYGTSIGTQGQGIYRDRDGVARADLSGQWHDAPQRWRGFRWNIY